MLCFALRTIDDEDAHLLPGIVGRATRGLRDGAAREKFERAEKVIPGNRPLDFHLWLLDSLNSTVDVSALNSEWCSGRC